MELLITISVLNLFGGCVLIFIFGQIGVLFASALSSLILSFCYLTLGSFGSPTGHAPKFSLATYCYTALLVLLYSLLVYYGVYLLRNFLLKEDIPSTLTKLWLGLILTVTAVHTFKNFYKGVNERNYNITSSHPET